MSDQGHVKVGSRSGRGQVKVGSRSCQGRVKVGSRSGRGEVGSSGGGVKVGRVHNRDLAIVTKGTKFEG